VVAEGLAAAATLHQRTGDARYADLAQQWWSYAERFLLDRERGSWQHQLDEENRPTDTVWPGKPDLYHAVQATLIPRYPVRASVAEAVLAGRAGEGS
jgi:sulfoquinovose isomerase